MRLRKPLLYPLSSDHLYDFEAKVEAAEKQLRGAGDPMHTENLRLPEGWVTLRRARGAGG